MKIKDLQENIRKEKDISRKYSFELIKMKKDIKQKNEELKQLTKYIEEYKSKLHDFNVGRYLKYKILSKLTFGGLRRRYKEKYKKQNAIYCAIKKGNF